MNMNCRIYAACSLGSGWQSASSHAHREIGVTRSEEPELFGVPFLGSSARLRAGLKHRSARGKGDDAALRASCRSNL